MMEGKLDDQWQRIVALCSSLHLTTPLRQLVPIHAALIHAVCDGGCDTQTDDNTTSTTDANDAFVEASIRATILLSEPPLQLLSVQYLLHTLQGLDRLTKVLVPLLRQQQKTEQQRLEIDDELREALLDAVFTDFTIGTTLDDGSVTGTAEAILSQQPWDDLPHSWSCRILGRLHPTCPVPDLVVQRILEGMTCLSTLRPVTMWLIPLLYNNDHCMQQVWQKCMELMAQVVEATQKDLENDEENETEKALIASAVLCTILPHINNNSKTNTTVQPLNEPLLWTFVSNLLHRGTHVVVKGGSFQYLDAANKERLRRRGLYILRSIVAETSQQHVVWLKYIMCFETLEMEQEQHLIDQVWDTVTDICLEASTTATASHDSAICPPPMTWDWVAAMLCRLFLSETPVLRKLALFRFLNSRAGIQIIPDDNESSEIVDERRLALQRPPRKKHSIKSKHNSQIPTGAPLSLVSTDFVLNIVMPSYDTLTASIGTNMNYEERGKIKVQDITPKAVDFLEAYVACVDEARLQNFVAAILSPTVLLRWRPKTVVMLLTAVAHSVVAAQLRVRLTEDVLARAVASLQQLFSSGSIVITFRHGILHSLANILSSSTLQGNLDPKIVLRVLTLYPLDLASDLEKGSRMVEHHPTYVALQKWIVTLGDSPQWASTTAAACAAAFVQCQLLSGSFDAGERWDPVTAAISDSERATGAAIVLLAALSSAAASALLWPAIHRGLSMAPSAEMMWLNANKASRALILLENGCRLEIVSGLGNGDLVIQRSTQQMMPPPPNIEQVLANAVGFLLNHVRALSSRRNQLGAQSDDRALTVSGNTRSSNTHRISTTFALLIAQLKVLAESYPSSTAVSSVSEQMLHTGIKSIINLKDGDDSMDVVTFTSLSYAALSCGADPWFTWDGISTSDACAKLLRLDFIGTGDKMVKQDEQTARSVFHYARWGCLSILLPKVLEITADDSLLPLLEQVFARALELAEATPMDALLPLFDSVRTAASSWLELTGDRESYPTHLERIISALFAAMSDMSTSSTATYMLNGICALLFRPAVLFDEYSRLQENPDYQAPVREAFLKLVKIAGCLRSHFLKAALCHICAGWLGSAGETSPGLGAIPYKNEVVQLLVHKETKLDESSTNQSTLAGARQADATALTLPPDTNASSIARGFVLVFFSRLPGPGDGIDPRVLTDFIHPVILTLLRDVCYAPLKSGASLMTGTEDYSIRIRSWQALCVLSRFVTNEISEEVCDRLYESLNQNLHGQIRYFMEIFAIQCARKHPTLFGMRLVKEITRIDLTLQQISSLMVLAGNLIVGRYKLDFFRQFETGQDGSLTLHQLLSGVIPWLSSTQGFSRAIAQLLVHQLIPLVIDVTIEDQGDAGDDWYLRSLYVFLDRNPEMKRLRNKQVKAFSGYDADHTCTVEGLLSTKVDESDEADPVHVIEMVKKCLEEVYLDAHEHDTPQWKQVERMLLDQSVQGLAVPPDGDILANFQRKIIPLDALDLAVDESREQRLRNASGRKRQSLVICASLIDKIPNLGGLARTAEIFAADRLVIPDMNVVRMDNFKSISVGAGDWIRIEECKEDVSTNCVSVCSLAIDVAAE
jgi:tRNA G18 (ribose-2'-O)-methylase SpoU